MFFFRKKIYCDGWGKDEHEAISVELIYIEPERPGEVGAYFNLCDSCRITLYKQVGERASVRSTYN